MRFKYKRYNVQISTFTGIGILVVAFGLAITYLYTWWKRYKILEKHKNTFSPMTSLDINPLSDSVMFNVSDHKTYPFQWNVSGIFQVQSDLFMSILRVTETEPDWLQWYNVAEVKYEDTKVREPLGEGKFGVVTSGVIQLENGLK